MLLFSARSWAMSIWSHTQKLSGIRSSADVHTSSNSNMLFCQRHDQHLNKKIVVDQFRLMATNSCLEGTPLSDNPLAKDLLEGLHVHTVPADGDCHPLAVYSFASQDQDNSKNSYAELDVGKCNGRRPILLLHGRTWSSVPVYHLKNRSIMECFHGLGMEPYAVDFRGFGGTPKDITGTLINQKLVFMFLNDVTNGLLFYSCMHRKGRTTSICK